MNSKNKNVQFGKNLNQNTNKNNNVTPQEQKNKLKIEIMEKYNISSEEFENIVEQLENKKLKIKNKEKQNNPQTPQKTIPKQKKQKNEISDNNSENTQPKYNVDSIISNIIPDYNEKVCVEVENLSLTFEVVPDKIDTLKETVIRTLKRNKSKKIKFQALDNINFKIYKGEKIGIIGYNGAGKSTLLKVITGIYEPNSGKVTTYGKISPLLSLGAGFDFNYSGRKNIYLNGAVLGYEKRFLEEKEKEIIEFSELEEFIDIPIKNYSSGMLAKLGFSIATILEPDILIIDEILGVGDVSFHRKSNDKMKSLMDDGTTVILVSHSMQQIRELCDKVIWIDKGKVREIGEVNQVCDNYIKDSEKASKEQKKNIQFK